MENKAHYANLAEIYDKFWFYSEDFVGFISDKIIEYLDINPNDRFVDLGCGTGIYSKSIREKIVFGKDIVCVDSSDEMLSNIPKNSGFEVVCMDAVEYTGQPGEYDKVLIKEMVHHLKNPGDLFNNIFDRLRQNGRFLLILLPPTIEYPLFDAAIRCYEEKQPHYDNLKKMLEDSGFGVEVQFIEYLFEMERETYFDMVRNRYMSFLSTFDGDELDRGLEEMNEKYGNIPVLKFVNRLVCICAIKA